MVKCQAIPPASQPPNINACGKVKGRLGEAL